MLDLQNREKIQKIYRFWSKFYDWFMKYWNRFVAKDSEKDLKNFLKKIKGEVSVLDLGCGTGINISRLKTAKVKVKDYTAIDWSPDMQKKAKEKAEWIENKKFILADITKYEPKKKFDLIICTMVLSHMKEPSKVVRKYFKHLNKKSYMITLFQGEAGRFSGFQKILSHINKYFQAKLIPEKEIKNFPKANALDKSYLKGYLRLKIYQK